MDAKICETCNKKFEVKPSRYEKAKYCSLKCFFPTRLKKETKICKLCKKKFLDYKYKNRIYCGRKCQAQAKFKNHKPPSDRYSLFGGKYCRKCLNFKTFSSFHRDSKVNDGYSLQCKSCVKEYQKWLKDNPADARKQLRKERELSSIRKCNVCQTEKPIEDFPLHSNKKHIQYRCKRCAVEDSTKRYWIEKSQGNKAQIRNRKVTLKRYYGITLEQYEEMFLAQKGVCKTCGLPETRVGRAYLSVDHCHQTKKIRGLLCSRCNTALGCAKDSIEILLNMVKYLQGASENKENLINMETKARHESY